MDEVARRVDARALGVRPDRLRDVLDRRAAAAPGDEVLQELTGALVEPSARRAAGRGPDARGAEDLDPDARGRAPAGPAGADRHDLEHGGAPAVVERRGAEQRSPAAGQRDGHVDDVLAAGERGRDHARAAAPRARPSGRRNAAPEGGTARHGARREGRAARAGPRSPSGTPRTARRPRARGAAARRPGGRLRRRAARNWGSPARGWTARSRRESGALRPCFGCAANVAPPSRPRAGRYGNHPLSGLLQNRVTSSSPRRQRRVRRLARQWSALPSPWRVSRSAIGRGRRG